MYFVCYGIVSGFGIEVDGGGAKFDLGNHEMPRKWAVFSNRAI